MLIILVDNKFFITAIVNLNYETEQSFWNKTMNFQKLHPKVFRLLQDLD